MDRLFWGLIFVLLDWKITLGTAVIEILPDFLGFYFMMRGMEELAGKDRNFDRGRHGAFVLAVAGGVLFGAELMNPDTRTQVFLWVAGLGMLAATLILVRVAVRGVEAVTGRPGTLSSMWLVLAVLHCVCYLVNWIPLVGTVCGWVALGTGMLFLGCFYREIRKSAE